MSETTLQVRVPALLLQFGLDENDVRQHVVEWLVLSLFTEGRISSGKDGRLLNLTRLEFLSLLRECGIAYVDYSPDELADEFAAAETIEARTGK